MRWVRFSESGAFKYGLLQGQTIQEVSGDPFAGYQLLNKLYDFSAVKLEVPVVPRTFYCAGLNYAEHALEAARKAGREANLPPKADIGYRANNALIAHDEYVVIPPDAGEKVHYEGELVVVIGKRASHLTEENALSCVLGYTIGNDVSERDWQRADRTLWRAKNSDTFKPMGPWIETDFEIEGARTIVRVNGRVTTEFKTADMIFNCAKFISEMTRYLTLWPGDVIWMGTDGASPNLNDGDLVEVEITGLGVLRNRFIRDKKNA